MRTLSALILGMCIAMVAPRLVADEPYPARPIHLVVGFPSGSQPDIVARLLAERLAESLRRPVVVDNVPGSAGNIAADRVAKARPDGYTVGLLSQTHLVVNPSLYKLPYDALRDFAPVTQLVSSPAMLVVHNALPAGGVEELVSLAKAHPGALTFASSGSGSGTHVAAELFKTTAGVDIRHIPYKGVVSALPDLVSGRVTMMFSPIPVVLPLVRAGKLRALAVTSLTRSSAAPDVPTLAESGYPGFEASNWYALVVPAATARPVVLRLHAATVEALSVPQLRGKLGDLGLDVIANTPEQFAAALQREIPKWADLIVRAGIKQD